MLDIILEEELIETEELGQDLLIHLENSKLMPLNAEGATEMNCKVFNLDCVPGEQFGAICHIVQLRSPSGWWLLHQ